MKIVTLIVSGQNKQQNVSQSLLRDEFINRFKRITCESRYVTFVCLPFYFRERERPIYTVHN